MIWFVEKEEGYGIMNVVYADATCRVPTVFDILYIDTQRIVWMRNHSSLNIDNPGNTSHYMASLIRILIVLSLCSSLNSFAEITTVKFYEPEFPDLGTRYFGKPISLSSDSTTARFQCYDENLIVNTQINDSIITYCLMDGEASILDLSFPIDSIKRWNEDNNYDKQSVRFVFRNNEFFFIPGSKMDYYVKAYNKFPFMLSVINFKTNSTSFPNTTLYLDLGDDSTHPIVKIRENGKLHRNEIHSGHIFKEKYSAGDTVMIGDKRFIIDQIDVTNAIISLLESDIKSAASYLNRSVYQSIAPYFNDNDYLLLVFWGTWCIPCLNGLATLKDLHDKYNDKVSFLSICFDDLANKDKATNLLNGNGISWSSIFEEFKDQDSITIIMEISYFPTFVLVNKTGRIETILIGEKGLTSLDAILSAI